MRLKSMKSKEQLIREAIERTNAKFRKPKKSICKIPEINPDKQLKRIEERKAERIRLQMEKQERIEMEKKEKQRAAEMKQEEVLKRAVAMIVNKKPKISQQEVKNFLSPSRNE